MPVDVVDSQDVALRLRAVMGDLELETVADLAKFLGAERSQVSNWLQGYNLPPISWMSVLCARHPGLTLDWLYRGIADAVPRALAIKLEALMQGVEVPLLTPPARSRTPHQAAARSVAQKPKRRKTAT